MNYVLSAGQNIVAQTAITMNSNFNFKSFYPNGTLKINGSSSMFPMIKNLSKEYKILNPNANIEITSSDSSNGIFMALNEKCDFALSSRKLENTEKDLLNYQEIAADGIVIIVNNQNPINNLTVNQLQEIYNKKITKWQDLK